MSAWTTESSRADGMATRWRPLRRAWPTEEEAVTHLRQLRAEAELREATPKPALSRRLRTPLGRYARPDGFG